MPEPYIFESPDKGKTILRRQRMSTEKEVMTKNNEWMTLHKLITMHDSLQDEAKIRNSFPAVQAAYENYQLLLKLAKESIDTSTDDVKL